MDGWMDGCNSDDDDVDGCMAMTTVMVKTKLAILRPRKRFETTENGSAR